MNLLPRARRQTLSAGRVNICPECRGLFRSTQSSPILSRWLATATRATTPALIRDSTHSGVETAPPPTRFNPSQPPSHRPPESRKSQLHRQYTSLIKSTPLLLLFQHLNLRSVEWLAIRRELAIALGRTDEAQGTVMANDIKIHAIQGSIFESALRVAEYHQPNLSSSTRDTNGDHSSISPLTTDLTSSPEQEALTHALSRQAHSATMPFKGKHPLTPLLAGPVAILSIPVISPAHLKTVLSVLAPNKLAGFPAPTRRQQAGVYDAAVQAGLQKLLLMGAQVQGLGVVDDSGVQYVGGLPGLETLRAQLVALLGGIGAQVVGTLNAARSSLYMTVEGRRTMLEDEAKEGVEL